MSLRILIFFYLTQSLALAEYTVFREIDPVTHIAEEVGAVVQTQSILAVVRPPLHQISVTSLPGTVHMTRRLTLLGPVMTTFPMMCASRRWSIPTDPTL